MAQTTTPTTEEAYNIDSRDEDKNRFGAAGLSLLLPGAGQMYVNESIWPEALITLTAVAGIAAFFIVDQQRANSIRPREINGGQTKDLADAQWEAILLLLQIAIPSFWLWNAGDAFKNAEKHNKNVIRNLTSLSKAYIIEENLFSVTLWQF
jgi:hypothetical protein